MTLPGTRSSTYQVKLEVFEGPLDLLLKLIEQEALDITAISLARVTDQYLAYLHVVEEVRPGELADFMVIAARLLLIKSRALLPKPPKIVEEEDVGDDLVRQLREYRLFKHAAQFLAAREQAGMQMYARSMPVSQSPQSRKTRIDLGDTSTDDLIRVLRALLDQPGQATDSTALLPHRVTIEQKIEQIVDRLTTSPSLTFRSLLTDVTSRVEVIVTLLALLELVRRRRVSVRQDQLFGEILISSRT